MSEKGREIDNGAVHSDATLPLRGGDRRTMRAAVSSGNAARLGLEQPDVGKPDTQLRHLLYGQQLRHQREANRGDDAKGGSE